MSNSQDDLQAFTVRLPRGLVAQITARGLVERRKRNSQIQYMLERQIEDAVTSDLKVIQSMSDSTEA